MYPVYTPPGGHPNQMPVYQNQQMGPQTSVYQNPNATRSDNRFGGPAQQPQAAQPQMPVYTPAPQQQPAQTTAKGETDMQLVSQGKTTSQKIILNTPSFKVAVRSNLFNSTNSVVYPTLSVTDCLDELVEQTIENLIEHERSPAAMVANGVVEMIYHKASQSKFANDLFQPDVKSVYKAFKTHLASINNRYDLVYLSAINDFLTEIVNDTLYPIMNVYPMIDSFTDDFNELLRSLRNNCTADVEDLFIDQINLILGKTKASMSVSENLIEVDMKKNQVEGEDADAVIQEVSSIPRAIIPIPTQVICLNYISAELGDAANLSRMLGGLVDMLESHVAYVCTIDKTIYKAFFNGDKVLLDLIRN